MANNTPINSMKSKINKGITMVTVKTGSSVEKAKLNTHIENVEAEIDQLKRNLGDKAYVLWETGNLKLEELEEDFRCIQEKKAMREALSKQIDEINRETDSILGKKDNSTPQNQGAYYCSNCGCRYEQKINFCVKCGNKI